MLIKCVMILVIQEKTKPGFGLGKRLTGRPTMPLRTEMLFCPLVKLTGTWSLTTLMSLLPWPDPATAYFQMLLI